MGCLAAERFDDPVLLEARDGERTLALALFNRRRGLRETLFLGESGDAVRDLPFVEYNGLLLHRDAPATLPAACWRAVRTAPVAGRRRVLSRRVVMSGIDDATLTAASAAGPLLLRRSLPAPSVDLARLRQENRDYLAGLSANARYQLRRSDRAYAALGALVTRRAESVAEAHAFLTEMAVLHQATWRARGRPGAFATPFFARFHRALIECGMPRDEIDLLRVTAGNQLVGILYNLRFRRSSFAYQSGFNYPSAGPHQKPGLTCHHQGIRFSAAQSLNSYDFLAGDDRYKRSLAGGAVQLHWLTLDSRWSAARGRQAVMRLLRGTWGISAIATTAACAPSKGLRDEMSADFTRVSGHPRRGSSNPWGS